VTDSAHKGGDGGTEPPSDIVFEDEPIDLSDLRWSDGLVLALFWVLAFVVFLQFFTRYVLNNSLGWTEEIARYLLIGVTFVGAIMATRKQSHIAVELLYRWLGRGLRRALQYFVDVVAIIFYVAMAWFTAQLAQRTGSMMVSIDVPKSIVYWIVCASFAFMAVYQAVALVRHVRTGTSPLIDPDASLERAPSME
jgi:TRAP-type C4-dicarboxylate transport system permease small subunit